VRIEFEIILLKLVDFEPHDCTGSR